MRQTLLLLAITSLLQGQCWTESASTHEMLLCVMSGSGDTSPLRRPVGNGVYRRTDDGSFKNIGIDVPGILSLAVDPRDSQTIYLAATNGCIQTADGGKTWRISTSWNMTEPRSVCVDPTSPDQVYLSLPDGIAVSFDRGTTWTRMENGMPERGKYAQVVNVDRSLAGRVLAGCESGIYLTEDGAQSWRLVYSSSATVDDIQQSPHDPKLWVAATQSDGALISRDGGKTWTTIAGVSRAKALYNVAFDARNGNRFAISSWTYGVITTEDGGQTWLSRNAGLPPNHVVFRVGIDPDDSRLYAAVYKDGLYVSGDFGRTWKRAGLEPNTVLSFTFVPNEAR